MKKILLLFCFVVINSVLFSLEFEVSDFREDPFDHVNDIGEQVLDNNADACAVLRVETDVPEEIYITSPRVYKKEKKVGTYYFYISHRKRLIKFTAKGYMPVTYKTPMALEKGRTYVVKLKAEDEFRGKISVTILSEPADAEKFINGKKIGSGETFNLKKGKWELELKKNGYKSIKRTIDVSENNFFFKDIVMEEITPKPYYIETSPSGAYIFLDENQIGKTPYEDYYSPGEYELKITKEGYLPINKRINIKEDVKNEFSYKLIKNSGFLSFEITPSFAQLKIDNKTYQYHEKIELVPNTYAISVFAEGYLPYNGKAEVKLGAEKTKSINLTENVGFLKLNVEPDDATILIDGKDYSKKSMIKLPPGEYTVDISKKEYLSQTVPVKISLQKFQKLTIDLKKNTGYLYLDVSPKDALVFINNKSYGTKRRIELVEKKYKLKIRKGEHHSYEEVIQINRGKTLRKKVELKSMLGNLQFKVEPRGTKIVLKKDDEIIKSWQGTEFIKNLFVGDYKLIAKANGFLTKETKIRIHENKTTKEFLQLKSGRDPESYSSYELREKIRSYKKKKYITLAITLVGYAVAGFMQYEAYDKYNQYNDATSKASSISLREDSKKWNNASYIAGGVSSVPWVPFFYYNHKQHFYEDLLRRK